MSSGLGQAAFRLGFFVVLVSGGLLLVEEHGSAEYTISLLTLIIGLIFLAIVAIWVRWSQRGP
jgi:hypothetical protein